MKATNFYLLFALCISQTALATDDLVLNARQIQDLGIVTAALSAKQQGELAGMPAQVVLPANQLFIISTPLPAMVEQTLVGAGDTVKKGQLLARLQSPALAEAQRGLLQATTQAQLAKDNLVRDEQLWQDGIIAESRYRATRSLHLEANAALAERRQMLRLSGMSDGAITQLQSGNNLNSLLTITSPIDGVVLEKTASVGQRLDAAVPLFKVAKLEPLGLEIQVPLASTLGLKIGAMVGVPAYGATGKLTAIGRSLSGSNQTILLRVLIQQGAEHLRPGQFVEASIAISAGNTVQWNVPNSALARVEDKTLVFVATAQGFRAEAVTVLHEGAQDSVVTGKLKGDEKIAVRGVSTLKASLMGIGGGE
ncbi:MAG: efflux RND transporter periplasmic adaptor subunit [Halothiobacillaceae bacterium]|nr:efflux RND transporter periplasmic adaptor subunit [Halothiobacillaceae bacterium]